jgi:hypothetical protein
MKLFFLTGAACLTVSLVVAQNSVVINQSGGSGGNQATVSQQGTGNTISINQSNTSSSRYSGQPGNRVRLRVDTTTQTTISQHGNGPNTVEVVQDGQGATIVNQSPSRQQNTVPFSDKPHPTATPKTRTPKRHNRR